MKFDSVVKNTIVANDDGVLNFNIMHDVFKVTSRLEPPFTVLLSSSAAQ